MYHLLAVVAVQWMMCMNIGQQHLIISLFNYCHMLCLLLIGIYSLPWISSSTQSYQYCSSRCDSILVTSICQWCLELHIRSPMDKWKQHCPQTSRHNSSDTWTPSWDQLHCGDNCLSCQHSLSRPIHDIHIHDNPKWVKCICLKDLTMWLTSSHLFQFHCTSPNLQDAPALHQC